MNAERTDSFGRREDWEQGFTNGEKEESMARTNAMVEGLEARRMLAADIAVALTATTLPDSLVSSSKISPTRNATLTVSVASGTIEKSVKGNVRIDVILRPSGGNATDINLGSATVPVSALAKKAQVKKITFSALKVAPPRGEYTLRAVLTVPTAVGDTNTDNNVITRSVVSADAPGTTSTPFAQSGINANVFTFKGRKIGARGLFQESGTFKTNDNTTGTYAITFGTGVADQGGTISVGGVPKFIYKFHPANGKSIGTLSGKTITFGVAEAGSKGYIDYAGGRVYYK